MADIRIKKRKRMRAKDIKALSIALSEATGAKVFGEDDAVDMAESSDFNLIFAGNEIVGLIHEERPFLTIRGVLRYKPSLKHVTVDMGAVSFISNGADCMGPGIVDAESSIRAGDLVWIRDVNNKIPLAIGISDRSAEELMGKGPGKAIRTIHFVGDKLWKAGE